MKHERKGVVRLHDRTDRGGEVITASSATVVFGKLAALHSDLASCPRCKGNFAIRTTGCGAAHEGRAYAYDGDLTDCGARLISSVD